MSIRKYEDDFEHGYLYFVWFAIFLNVVALQFKTTSEKMATLMKDGFLQADAMLEVYQGW